MYENGGAGNFAKKSSQKINDIQERAAVYNSDAAIFVKKNSKRNF